MSWGFCWGENWEGWQPHFPSLPQSSSIHNLWSVPSCMLSLCLPALLCQCLFLLFCITLYSFRDIVTLQGHGSTYILRPLKLKVAASLITFRLTTNHIQHDVFPDYSTWAHSLILYLMLYIYQFMPMHRGRKIYKRGKKTEIWRVFFLSCLHLQQTLWVLLFSMYIDIFASWNVQCQCRQQQQQLNWNGKVFWNHKVALASCLWKHSGSSGAVGHSSGEFKPHL